jgi:hypothetical protein
MSNDDNDDDFLQVFDSEIVGGPELIQVDSEQSHQVRQIVVPKRFGGKMAYFVQDDDNDSEHDNDPEPLVKDDKASNHEDDDKVSEQAQPVVAPQRFGVKMACYEKDKRDKESRQRCSALAETIFVSIKGQRELFVENKAVFDRLASFRMQARAAKKALKTALAESNLEVFSTSNGDFNCEIVQKKKQDGDEQPRIVLKIKREKPTKQTKSKKRVKTC